MTETVVQYKTPAISGELAEQVLIGGDLSKLTPGQRADYYLRVCQSVGLNPLTKPFEYIELNSKLVLYARRDATDQLRATRHVNITIAARELVEDVYTVTARATMPDGRTDESIGAVALATEDGEWKTAQSGKRYFAGNGNWKPLRGDARANAMMKAETKAKRRVTLSICGLGMLDETEAVTVPDARPVAVDTVTGEIVEPVQTPAISPLAARPTNGEAKRAFNDAAVARLSAGVIADAGVREILRAQSGDYGKAVAWLVEKFPLPQTEPQAAGGAV